MCSNPLSRFSPPLSRVAASTSGLVSGKFAGESASTNWRAANSALALAAGSRSASAVALRIVSEASRYDWRRKSKTGVSRHAGAAKRLSLTAATGLASGEPVSNDCHSAI